MKTITIAALGFVLATGAFAESKYNKRDGNQQERIAQGVKSGQLTAKETARLERREAALNHRVKAERAANGGHLTPAERKAAAHRQNQLSREIYKEKHDSQIRH